MAVTLEEIAKRAGVSTGTVSRVLNGLNKENRPAIARRSAMIRKIAQEMNYRPNHAARQMLRGKFDLVGFLNACGEAGSDWFPPKLLHSIHEELYSRGKRLLVTEIERKKFADPEYAPSLLQQAMVDGLIVHPGRVETTPVTEFFNGDPIPVVYINNDQPFNAVRPDDFADAYSATVRLIEAGHRNIGFYRPIMPGVHDSVSVRLAGFEKAMTDHGLSPHRSTYPDSVVYQYEDGMPSAHGFLDLHADLTAALCYDTQQAVSLHAALCLRGLKPPHAFCLVVFFETEFHWSTGIPIATSIVAFDEIGKLAVKMVEQIAEGASEPIPSVSVRSTRFCGEGLIVPPQPRPV